MHFTDITVIYNPHSTGSGRAMARKFQRQLTDYTVKVVATEYAGHAEEVAYTLAKASAKPLIISASGDGGYHEVVNGIMRAQKEGAHPTAGLLPAGNANDHYHDVHDKNIVTAINQGTVRRVDLLRLVTTHDQKVYERYAHSYIGFGLTPEVARELNKVDLNRFNEIWIVLKALFMLQPIKIVIHDKKHTYYSLIFSNIGKMSKVLSLSKQATNDDGKFEVTIFKRRNKLRLIKLLLKASTSGLAGTETNEPYVFRTIKPLAVQIDGEISTIDAKTTVTVDIKYHSLNCIV